MDWIGPRNHVLDGGRDPPMGRGNFWGKGCPLYSICRGLYKNGWTDWFVFWVVDLGGLKEAQVQSYSHGGAIVHNFNRIRQAAPMNRTTLCRELCKTGWTDRFAIWLWTWMGRKKHKFIVFATLEGTLAPLGEFYCGGSAVLCQITLTTSWY